MKCYRMCSPNAQPSLPLHPYLAPHGQPSRARPPSSLSPFKSAGLVLQKIQNRAQVPQPAKRQTRLPGFSRFGANSAALAPAQFVHEAPPWQAVFEPAPSWPGPGIIEIRPTEQQLAFQQTASWPGSRDDLQMRQGMSNQPHWQGQWRNQQWCSQEEYRREQWRREEEARMHQQNWRMEKQARQQWRQEMVHPHWQQQAVEPRHQQAQSRGLQYQFCEDCEDCRREREERERLQYHQ